MEVGRGGDRSPMLVDDSSGLWRHAQFLRLSCWKVQILSALVSKVCVTATFWARGDGGMRDAIAVGVSSAGPYTGFPIYRSLACWTQLLVITSRCSGRLGLATIVNFPPCTIIALVFNSECVRYTGPTSLKGRNANVRDKSLRNSPLHLYCCWCTIQGEGKGLSGARVHRCRPKTQRNCWNSIFAHLPRSMQMNFTGASGLKLISDSSYPVCRLLNVFLPQSSSAKVRRSSGFRFV